MRKCFEVMVKGIRIRGVAHLPPPGPAAEKFDGMGIVLLHPGFLPRSGIGDAVVALGDGLARHGIMTARIDMAGLGDSEGDLAETAMDFVGPVQNGEFAEPAWDCIKAVKAHFGLRRVVVGGYCGGAISGLFMAARHRNELPAGLFALETSFKVVTSADAMPARHAELSAAEQRRARYEKLKLELHWVATATPIGRGLLKIYHLPRLFSSRRSASPQGALPQEANHKLLRAIDVVLQTSMPLLFITAAEVSKQAGFDYVGYALAGYPGRATHRSIHNTDHSLAEGEGPAKVLEYVTEWLGQEVAKGPDSGTRVTKAQTVETALDKAQAA